MSESDILAMTYTDSCVVYRPHKEVLPSGESSFKKGLEGVRVCEDIPCALSSPTGGKLQKSKSTAAVETDYCLFVRPEVDIQPNDTLEVLHLGKRLVLIAGLADRQPSHNNVPLKLGKDKA